MWCLVVFLVTCGFMLACRGHALGVAAGPCLRGVFLRVHQMGALSGGVRWAVLVVWVGVSALRLWAAWQGRDGKTTAGLHTSSVTATSRAGESTFEARLQTCFPLHSVPTNANSSPPPSTSTRPTDFSVAKQFDATKRLAITIVPQHSAASHTPTALNCLFCAFLLVLSRPVPSLVPASFCTLEYATQKLQTLTYPCHRSLHLQRSRTLSCITATHRA